MDNFHQSLLVFFCEGLQDLSYHCSNLAEFIGAMHQNITSTILSKSAAFQDEDVSDSGLWILNFDLLLFFVRVF